MEQDTSLHMHGTRYKIAYNNEYSPGVRSGQRHTRRMIASAIPRSKVSFVWPSALLPHHQMPESQWRNHNRIAAQVAAHG
eukprot:SAG11_NODE_873_length_6802_cov_2.257646_5_plen_80_part_00